MELPRELEGASEMAQQIDMFMTKPNDVSSILRTHIKNPGMVTCPFNLSTREVKIGGAPTAYWSTSQDKLVNFRPMRDLVLKKTRQAAHEE